MKNYAVNKIAAFAKRVASLFTRFQTALSGAGYDATDMIASLNTRADALPATEGFFFGGPEVHEEDIEDLRQFIAKSREAMANGLAVIYDSWW